MKKRRRWEESTTRRREEEEGAAEPFPALDRLGWQAASPAQTLTWMPGGRFPKPGAMAGVIEDSSLLFMFLINLVINRANIVHTFRIKSFSCWISNIYSFYEGEGYHGFFTNNWNPQGHEFYSMTPNWQISFYFHSISKLNQLKLQYNHDKEDKLREAALSLKIDH